MKRFLIRMSDVLFHQIIEDYIPRWTTLSLKVVDVTTSGYGARLGIDTSSQPNYWDALAFDKVGPNPQQKQSLGEQHDVEGVLQSEVQRI